MQRRHKWITPASFLCLPLLVYCAFVILPTLNSLFYSFTDWVGYGDDFNFVGLANFERVFTDRLFRNAISNTAIWLALAMTVPTLLGLGLALALQGKSRINALYKSLFYLPICLSPIIVGIIWVWLYSPKLGIVNLALRSVGLDHIATAWLANPGTALYAVFVAWAWQQTGLNMVIFLAGLTSVPTPLDRSSQGRRRQLSADPVQGHHPHAAARDSGGAGADSHQRAEELRSHLGHDHGRTLQPLRHAGGLHVQRILPQVQNGLWQLGGGHPLPDDADHHRALLPADPRGGATL